MSEYYKPQRIRNVYDPSSDVPFRISRAKVELFMNCRRCFYLDVRLGTGRPPSMPFNLNSAVDENLKREFDGHRAAGTTHPLMAQYGIEAVPYSHPSMDEWREALRGGVRYTDPDTNFLLTGAPDDIWINGQGELHVVDYKATSKDGEVTLDAPWQIGYKRQVSFYQWLLRHNGFPVHPRAYFVYANGRRDQASFDGKLEFSITIIPHEGDDTWVVPALTAIHACLRSSDIPAPADDCDYCAYRAASSRHEST